MVLSCHFGVLQTHAFSLYNIELPGYSSEILPSMFHIKNGHTDLEGQDEKNELF